MIPTKTLRERMTKALPYWLTDRLEDSQARAVVDLMIQAIGDPCLIKTADSLEPTITFRAQDMTADGLVDQWCDKNWETVATEKLYDARRIAEAMRAWPTRKMPD